ncbi:MAG TPA: ROK family transcriptional regulator [Anaerolineaceae bacterium]
MNDFNFLGSNTSLVKAHNLRAILLTLLHEEHVSRVELAKRTSLSTTTITNLVDELLAQGIVAEEQGDAPTLPRQVGRPRTALRLVLNARYAVGVHIGIGILRVGVTNLNAELAYNSFADFDIQSPADDILKLIAVEVEKAIHASGIDRSMIIGVGIGASGLTSYRNGVTTIAPRLGWHNVPVRDRLQELLNLPCVVDNNVRCMAVGEAFFGLGRGVNTLIFVYGRAGIGAGIVVDRMVYRGSAGGAGEIGHTIMDPEGDLCRCGRRGCLETLISEPVLVREAQKIAQAYPASLIAQYFNQPGEDRPIERVFAAARAGDPLVQRMIEKRTRYLGTSLAYLVNLFDPDLILLGGVFAQGQDVLLPIAEATMRELAFGGLGEKVRLQPTGFGWRAGVIGAAALALTSLFYFES